MMSKSPTKMGGASMFFVGGSIADIIAAAGATAKAAGGAQGSTMDNKALKKLGGTGSVNMGARSQNSRGTRRTGTASRKSKAEEDFENMDIDNVQVLIEMAEREMKTGMDAKRKIGR